MNTPFLKLPEEYTADTLWKRYSDPSGYYECFIKNDEESKEGIIKSRRDWSTDNLVNTNAFPSWFNVCLNSNQALINYLKANNTNYSSSLIDTEEFLSGLRFANILMGVYRTSDDAFMGFMVDKIVGKDFTRRFRCILPEFREQGITDSLKNGLIFLFDIIGYDTMTGFIENTNDRTAARGERWGFQNKEQNTSGERGYRATWNKVVITKDVWDSSVKNSDGYKNLEQQLYDEIKEA